jgi:hypothetical protein
MAGNEWRAVRVYVSSQFEDCFGERALLEEVVRGKPPRCPRQPAPAVALRTASRGPCTAACMGAACRWQWPRGRMLPVGWRACDTVGAVCVAALFGRDWDLQA